MGSAFRHFLSSAVVHEKDTVLNFLHHFCIRIQNFEDLKYVTFVEPVLIRVLTSLTCNVGALKLCFSKFPKFNTIQPKSARSDVAKINIKKNESSNQSSSNFHRCKIDSALRIAIFELFLILDGEVFFTSLSQLRIQQTIKAHLSETSQTYTF